MDRVLRVDMTRLTTSFEPLPDRWRQAGGRLLSASIITEEIDPLCHPLGEQNIFVLAAGLLAGTPASSTGRLSIGGKSPLTGGIKESNAGGTVAQTMARLGCRAVVVHRMPQLTGPYLLWIGKDEAKIMRVPELVYLGNYQLTAALRERFGSKISTVTVGPAAERRALAAGVACSDKEGQPSRFAGRGGLGAVMAAKGLKAIVLDSGQRDAVGLARPEEFRMAATRLADLLRKTPQTAEVYRIYGTAATLDVCNSLGAFPTRNFRRGQFDGADQISGNKVHDIIVARGGEGTTTHACMPGCVIQCSNIYPDKSGSVLVSPLEYETIGLLGANLEISDLDAIAALNRLCNDLGVDTMEIGATLGVLMEAGVLKFGDAKAAIELVKQIREGTPLARVLASGAVVAGKVCGVARVPAVKGQAMAAYDPRAIKGMGVTYATSPMGADHTAGYTMRAPVDHLSPKGQWEVSRNAQISVAIYDSLGVCSFVGTAVKSDRVYLLDLVNARFGWDWNDEELLNLGVKVLQLEREFNRKAGFSVVDDRLPLYFRQEPLPPHNSIFDVAPQDLVKAAQ